MKLPKENLQSFTGFFFEFLPIPREREHAPMTFLASLV